MHFWSAVYRHIPSAVTAVRLGSVPLLVFMVRNGLFFYGAALFLFLLLTDFLDGYLARRLGLVSKLGAYFDVGADFILIFSMFVAFGSAGFYADWTLFVIAAVFAWFLMTSCLSDKMYDPVGKYYGSLLYGVIGLRFVLSGQLFCSVVTAGVAAFAVASILSRILSLWSANDREPRLADGLAGPPGAPSGHALRNSCRPTCAPLAGVGQSKVKVKGRRDGRL